MACVRNHMFSVGGFDVCVYLLERISDEHTVLLLCFTFHTHCCRCCCCFLSCFSIRIFAPTNGIYPAQYINNFSTVAFLQLPPSTETIHNENLSTSLTSDQIHFTTSCQAQIAFVNNKSNSSFESRVRVQKDIRIVSVWKCSLREFHQFQSTFFSLTKCFDVCNYCVCCSFNQKTNLSILTCLYTFVQIHVKFRWNTRQFVW